MLQIKQIIIYNFLEKSVKKKRKKIKKMFTKKEVMLTERFGNHKTRVATSTIKSFKPELKLFSLRIPICQTRFDGRPGGPMTATTLQGDILDYFQET